MRKYREFLLTGEDTPEDLLNHITDEVSVWMYNRMDKIAYGVWRESEK
jgi:hypothetical protein